MLNASKDEVADRLALSPLQDVRSKAIVGKAFGWIHDRVSGEFQMDVYGFDVGSVGSGGFVWVVLDGSERLSAHSPFRVKGRYNLQTPEPALQSPLLNIVRNTKDLVEVAGSA